MSQFSAAVPTPLQRQNEALLKIIEEQKKELEEQKKELQDWRKGDQRVISEQDFAQLRELKIDRIKRRMAALKTRKFNAIRIVEGHREFPELASASLTYWEDRARKSKEDKQVKATKEAATEAAKAAAKEAKEAKEAKDAKEGASSEGSADGVGKTSLGKDVIARQLPEHQDILTRIFFAGSGGMSRYAADRNDRNDRSHNVKATEVIGMLDEEDATLLSDDDRLFATTFFEEFFGVPLSYCQDRPKDGISNSIGRHRGLGRVPQRLAAQGPGPQERRQAGDEGQGQDIRTSRACLSPLIVIVYYRHCTSRELLIVVSRLVTHIVV